MTALGQLFGLGTPAEQDRITHDLALVRRHGLEALRHQLDGRPAPADLYIATIARLAHNTAGGARRAWEDFERDEQHQDDLRVRRGGNR